jgi:hypothetical protein
VNRSRENRTRIKTSDTTIFIPWFGQVEHLPSPRCSAPTDEGCTQPLSSDPMINLNTMVLFISSLSLCEESPQFGVSQALHKMISNEHRSNEGIATHTKATVTTLTHTKDESEHTKAAQRSYNSEKCSNLYHSESNANAKSRHLRMFKRCLVYCFMRLGVPFIALRQLGAVGAPFGGNSCPSAHGRTG